MPDIQDIERAIRSLRCATDHLQNAKDNPAFDEDVEAQELIGQTMNCLQATLVEARRLLKHESAAQNDA